MTDQQKSEAKIFTIKYKEIGCSHKQVELDLETRQVNCTQCRRIIDAFDFLMSCSVGEGMALAQLTRLKEEARKLEIQVNNLKKQKVFLGKQRWEDNSKKTTP